MAELHLALAAPRTKDEAFTIIRTLIDEVRLIPESGQLRVEMRGALAGILALGPKRQKPPAPWRGWFCVCSVIANQVGCGGTI